MMRHPKSGKLVLNPPDENGFSVCQYTKKSVRFGDHIFIGPVVPQADGTYICAKDAMPFFRAAGKEFHAVDRNCNTCRHLIRVKHDRREDGMQPISCADGKFSGVLMNHPDDCTGMECWKRRL